MRGAGVEESDSGLGLSWGGWVEVPGGEVVLPLWSGAGSAEAEAVSGAVPGLGTCWEPETEEPGVGSVGVEAWAGASGAGAAWSAWSGEAWAGLEAEGLASSASSGRPATWRGGEAVSPPGRESGSREVVTTVSLGCRASRWVAAGHEAPCPVPSVGTGGAFTALSRLVPGLDAI